MKSGAREATWFDKLPYFGGLALLVYMPFHVFLSQSLSTVTGGLNAWKIAKDALTFIITLFVICLVWKRHAATRTFNWLVGFGLAYAALHALLWALHPHIYRTSALVGLDFNLRVVAYAVIGYGAALLYPKFNLTFVLKLVVWVSAVVALLGVVQYFLPPDTLKHFGYSTARGVRPGFFIDNNPKYPRIFATLRDPNSYGAYLILPMTILLDELLRTREQRRRTMCAVLFVLEGIAMLLTFSRSAWIAAFVAFALTIWWRFRVPVAQFAKRWWPALAVAFVLLSVGIFASRHDSFVKSYIIHSTGKPQGAYDSDGFHWYYVKHGIEGIWHNPLGHGPGTAGLASIQNPHGGLLTENYYVQIGYEVGVEGLALFIAINVLLYMKIQKRHDRISFVLLATFWAYVVTNMLLHMWSNEPVALEWWFVAGVACVWQERVKT
ncbi:MAG TPA: O-antigen ligase family protein [Candidatus Saccharimonadales bacterium]